MNCCVCKNHPQFICSCISPSVFICNEHLDFHMSVPGNHVFRIQNIMDLLPILLNDLKIIKVQIRANYYFENEEVLEQVSKSIKEIKNYLKNFEKTLDIDEKNLLKLVYGLKSLKCVDFEDLGNFKQ